MLFRYLVLCVGVFFVRSEEKNCSEILANKDIAEEFPYFVAHGSHSLTLNDLRAFFDEKAAKNNGIAVVNHNLTGDVLLQNAPWITPDRRFSSPAFFALDQTLSHMDDNLYDIKNANALDRIAHALHMQEFWLKSSLYFKDLPRKFKLKKVCKCIEKMYGQMIGRELSTIAKQIREPEKMYSSPGNSTRYGGGGYSYSFRGANSLRRSQAKAEAGIPIEDEESWALWKDYTTEGLTEAVMEKMARSFALYLRCNLKVKDTTL